MNAVPLAAPLRDDPRYGDEAILHDLGSKNGTFVNGASISEPRVLRHRDVIAAGVVTMTFQDTRTSDSTMTVQVK